MSKSLFLGSWILDLGLVVLLVGLPACTGPQLQSDTAIKSIPKEIRSDLTVSGEIHVRGEVKVFPGVVLTVKPGTKFLFEPFDPDGDGVNDSRLFVEGRLVARGEPDAPIHFTSASENPEPGDWLEIGIERSEGTVLEYCVLKHSRYGLHVHFSSGTVANCIFQNNIDGTRFGNSRFTVYQNLFRKNIGKGINLRKSETVIYANILEENRHGIFIFEEGDEGTILNNRFTGNSSSDIRFGDFYTGDIPVIENNFRDNDELLKVVGLEIDIPSTTVITQETTITGARVTEVTLNLVWEQEIGSFIDAGIVDVEDGKIAVASWEEGITLLNAFNGSILERMENPDIIDATPVFYGGRLYYPSWDRVFRSVDINRAEVISELGWDPSPDDDHRQASALMENSMLIAAFWNGQLASLDPDTLEPLWETRLDGAVRASPAYDGRSLWVGTDNGTLFEISPGGDILRKFAVGERVRTTPLVNGQGDLFLVTWDGMLLRMRDGKISWRRKLPGTGTYASPVAPGPGYVIAGDGSGSVSMVDDAGALRWQAQLDSPVQSLGMLEYGVWAGTENGRLVLLDPMTGMILAGLEAGAAVHSPPMTRSKLPRTIFWGSRDGKIRAHKIEALITEPWEGPAQ